jgi:hypothetical protein
MSSVRSRASYGNTAQKLWADKRVRIAVNLLLITVFSALTALAKNMHPSVGIPGSSAIFWLTAMITGRSVVKMEFAGLLIGCGTAAWGIPIGLEHTFGYNVLLYGASGLLLDAMTKIPKISLDNLFGAALCGLTAHMAKYGFIVYAAVATSVSKHFIIVGFVKSAAFHAAFGIAAGLIAWGIVKASRLGIKRLT